MLSEIFLDEALKKAEKAGHLKQCPDINSRNVLRGIGKLTGAVRKRVEKVFERVAQGLGTISPKELAKVLPIVVALGGVAGCTFDAKRPNGLKFKDAQADGIDTGKDGSDSMGGDAKIEVKPVDAVDIGDILDDLNDVLYVPETEVKGDVEDAGGDDGSEPVDADAGDKQDVPEVKDVPDEEVPPPCAGVDCDDKDPCTDDKCDEETDQCGSTPKPLADDGDKCTDESCGADGETVHTPVDPNDGDPCTEDTCDPATGKKINTPKNVNDNDPCTDDECDPVTGEPVNKDKDCGDGNPFTVDSCNPATGECNSVPIACDDQDPCTKDTYNPLTGCSNEPIDCEDGDACTTGDACNSDSGKCESTPKNCADGDECTKDACLSPDGDCVNPAKPIENDGNPCTKDGCDPATGLPTHVEIPCSDGNACTVWDECNPANGACEGSPVDCDDKDGCTKDTCDPATGCKNTPVKVDDGNPCTTDTCDPATGEVKNTPVNVDDGNACTTDKCNPVTGAITHEVKSTDDGNPCTDDLCNKQTGEITHPLKNISDGDPCTDDLCNPQNGAVTHVQKNCDDGISCTVDACAGGFCVSVPIDQLCETLNQCATPACDLEAGCFDVPLTGTPCDNGDGCDTGEKCKDGAYGGGTPKTVDDNDACTIDSCVSPAGTVLHEQMDCGELPDIGCLEGKCLWTVGNASSGIYTIKVAGSGAIIVTFFKNGTVTADAYNPNTDVSLTCNFNDFCAAAAKKAGLGFYKFSIDSSDPSVKMTRSSESFAGELPPGSGYSNSDVLDYFTGDLSHTSYFETQVNGAEESDSVFGPVKKN